MSLAPLIKEVEACRICEPHSPLGPRPVVRLSKTSSIVIVGQAPGTKVHASGIPWNDPSGDHLREWLRVDSDTFYDTKRFAIVPMGFCYPGRKGQGDAPPRKECAPTWHARLMAELPSDHVMVLAGQYAHAYYLGKARKKTLTETVRHFAAYGPRHFPLPHPSWRSKGWMKRNPWFEKDVLPALRVAVHERLS